MGRGTIVDRVVRYSILNDVSFERRPKGSEREREREDKGRAF